VVASVQGKDSIDNQIQTIAWLANHLAHYDLALEAGQCIMTGSMTKPTPIEKGDAWETTFSSIGSVSATFD
jgi:2-keto-4-pentenoate hydratase